MYNVDCNRHFDPYLAELSMSVIKVTPARIQIFAAHM
jgi:hypothetical protein